MAQYIDKDALVVEIERRNAICKKVALDLRTQENKDYYQGKAEAYKEVLDILDTPEVKEVDLEKEIDREIETRWRGEYLFTSKFRESAKHFFELGLKAKGE